MDKKKQRVPLSFGMFLVTIGIVYGDIGTSPMYVMKSIIASQALITGSYTLVSEAIRLDLMPHMLIRYPSDTKGQLYIGTVNTVLWIGCSLVVLYFRSGSRMESAYGLAITVTMLMTTLLLAVYLRSIRKKTILAGFVLIVFGAIESVFFLSSLAKFAHGGYVAVIMATLLFAIMVIWYRGTELEQKYTVRLRVRDYLKNFEALRRDETTPICAQNLVYIDKSNDTETLDRDILYSILDRDPKRAEAHWYGLDTSSLIVESVPLSAPGRQARNTKPQLV